MTPTIEWLMAVWLASGLLTIPPLLVLNFRQFGELTVRQVLTAPIFAAFGPFLLWYCISESKCWRRAMNYKILQKREQ